MKQTLMNIRNRLNVFMSGRYGSDELGRTLTIAWIAVLVVSGFASTLGVSVWTSLAFTLLSLILAAAVVSRFLSKKIFKRSAENDKFLKLRGGISEFFHLQKVRRKERKVAVYKKCPHCKKVMRIPRVNGKHTVRCPMCGETYKVNIRGGEKK